MPKDETYIERDEYNNKTQRQHDTIPVKRGKDVVDMPRMVERKAFSNLAYGDLEEQTEEQAQERYIRDGLGARCTRCGKVYPANSEHFRTDNSKRRGITQPCLDCHRSLSRRRMAEHRAHAMYRRTSKFKNRGK